MKTCEACHRLFPDDGGFCPIDGQPLAPIERAVIPPDATDPRVGATLCGGRYKIYRRVADGGMGRVYQGLDKKDGRSVALKILHPDVAQDEVCLERFKREFECSAALPHAFIVEVLAFEETEDKSFALVMEYLEGEELRMLLKRERVLAPERVIRIMSQAAIGLSAAHERKIVHRDLKPDNIFLIGTRDGDNCKILDFGSVRDNSANAKKLTAIGTTIGSPYYMAPEQAQALDALDHRADVWSLAAITYECVTGKVPFTGPTGPAILLSILTEDPKSVSEVGKAHRVPVTLDAVIEEALVKNMEIRIPTVGALVDRIGQAYGLDGSHEQWAKTSQAELGARIAAGLPKALSAHGAKAASVPDMRAMDAAFQQMADPFKAGSPGGPVPAPPSSSPAPLSDSFGEDIVMGVPQGGSARWILAAIAGAAVIVGALVAFLVAR